MARSFLFLMVALATSAAVLGASAPVFAQPAISPSGAAAPAATPVQSDYFKQALQSLAQNDYGNAFKNFDLAAKENPKLPSPYILMFSYLARPPFNRVNHAKAWLDRAFTDTPSDPEPWIIIGQIALQENRWPEAHMDFLKASQLLEPYNKKERKSVLQEAALSGIASVFENRHQWPQAQQQLEKFLQSAPDDLTARQRLARALFWQSKVNEAYKELQEAKKSDLANVSKDPTGKTREQMLPAAAMLAQFYDAYEHETAKEWTECARAKDWFKFALKNSPNDLSLREVVAVWALVNGELALAKEQAKEAVRIEQEDLNLPFDKRRYPGSTTGKKLQGVVALWSKNWADAEKSFKAVIDEQPNDFAATNNLALALVEQDDKVLKDKALQYAQRNYEVNKDNAQAFVEAASTLSWVYYRRDSFDQAGTVMDFVIQKTGGNLQNPDTMTYVAYILNHKGGKYQAKQILEPLIKSGRPFSMRPEAQKLYDVVKDEKPPESATTPTPTSTTPKIP